MKLTEDELKQVEILTWNESEVIFRLKGDPTTRHTYRGEEEYEQIREQYSK